MHDIAYQRAGNVYHVLYHGRPVGHVQHTGTAWAGYRVDGACIGTAKTRRAIARALALG